MRTVRGRAAGGLEDREIDRRLRLAPRVQVSRVVVLIAATLALVLPGASTQALGGLPLSPAGLVCAAVLAYAGLALPGPGRVVSRWLAVGFAVVIATKLVAASLAPPLGLEATYFVGSSFDGAPERSTDFSPARIDGATRLDPMLDLRGESFGAHFFNDTARFNFGPEVAPGRDQLTFSTRWRGWLLVPSDGERRFVIESTGPAHVTLDDVELTDSQTRRTLAAGLHALRVDYARPEARVPWLRLSWERVPGGPLVPVGGADVRFQPSTAATEPSYVLGLVAEWSMATLLVVWCAFGLARVRRGHGLGRAALGGVPLLFLVHGMLLQAPLIGHTTVLSGLDDWLVYESGARDILLNGPLMDGGQGHATPFYGQPLYPYVLALAHRLTGESLFGPLALQFAALGLVVIGTAVLARRAFGTRLDALAALAGIWLLVQLEPEHFKVARQLFNENLYMPLVMASLIVVVGLARRRQPIVWWRALLVGGLLGLTAISRSQFLLFVPFGLLVVLIAWRVARLRAVLAVIAMLAGLVVTIAPVTARNWIVSGQVVLISSSGGASLLEFHRPPPGLIDQAALQSDPVYEALHLDTQTRTVLTFVRADPRGYFATWLPLGAHSVGLQGRNDPGVYWPLLVTSLLYVGGLMFKRSRRLHVWPIHAFVFTHLLVLMLFEADTYGYRLVMPMYAPMMVVAAQIPLALARRLARSGFNFSFRSTRPGGIRVAEYVWALLAFTALAWQAGSLVEVWPDREVALHGLGGPAAQAATTADQVGAQVIYVASIDGTPRRFGAGSLPGLRYPWFKWFDPSRTLPLPPASETAVYMLSELAGQAPPGDLVACLGSPDVSSQRVIDGAQVREQCVGDWPQATRVGASFDGVARIDAVRIPDAVDAGDALETRLVWQPLVARPTEPQQVSLQLDDPAAADGTLWGNGTLELYPVREWDPAETLLSRMAVATDPTAIPQRYRVTVGIGPTRANAPPALATWQGSPTDRVPVSTVAVSPGNGLSGQALPADMRPLEGTGPASIGGGLELIGARVLPTEAAIGGPLRFGLLWRAARDAPDAAQLALRLVRDNGEVVQETALPLLGGRLAPSALHAGNVVRDEQTLLIQPNVPVGPLFVEVGVLDARGASLSGSNVRLGSVTLTGRAHVMDAGSDAQKDPEATFGEAMQLLTDRLEPAQARGGDKVTVHLRWRGGATMSLAYKVFVHVLDPSGDHVVAQRDAEPQDGRAPTTGWVVGEFIDDDYALTLPAGLGAGDYPVELGVYDARSGDRLKLPNGDNRLVLKTPLQVH